MGWNNKRYENVKTKCANDIARGHKKAKDYMIEYKKMIVIEDYEAAKVITDVLKPLNYDTLDTHPHIKELNEK